MKAVLDSNVLGYAEGIDEPERQQQALALMRAVPSDRLAIPVQVLGELFNILVRKARLDRHLARDRVLMWRDGYATLETTHTVVSSAVALAAAHQFSIWDAIVLGAASEAGCRILLSEDMQDGFTWGGVTVVNPFASPSHQLLDDLRA